MNEYQSAAGQLERQWYFTTVLLGAYKNTRTVDQLTQASKRLIEAGYSKSQIQHFATNRKLLRFEERNFWDGMNSRNFSVEQMISFVEAPRKSEITSHSQVTREQIQAQIEHTWKTPAQHFVKGAAERMDAAKALVVLCGVVACSGITAVGLAQGNADILGTAQLLQTVFPNTAQKILDAVPQVLAGVGLGVGGMGAWWSLKGVKRSSKISKAKDVDLLKTLAQQPQTNGVVSSLQGASSHKADEEKLKDISLAHQNLLTHLDGNELRLFLHGNDQLRGEILSSRPPSYEQRVGCVLAQDASMFRKWIDELKLMGTSWDGVLASPQVGFKSSLKKMREKNNPTIPSALGVRAH